MKYKYILPTFCLFSTLSLYAEQQSDLGNIIQQAGQKNVLVKPGPKKKRSKKESRFTFVDRYDESKAKKEAKDKSESYEYENKERFKFKFNPGTGYNNIAAGSGGGSTGGGGSAGAAAGGGMSGGGMSGGGMGGGGQGGGGRR